MALLYPVSQLVQATTRGLARISYPQRTEHCGFETRKVWKRVVERQDLSWAYKGKVTKSP